jgi:hypothetical protein
MLVRRHLPVLAIFAIAGASPVTTPWAATIACGRGAVAFQEIVCAENPPVHYEAVHNKVPVTDRPDF